MEQESEAERELAAEVGAVRARNEDELRALRATAEEQAARHAAELEEAEKGLAVALRAARQEQEDKLQELVLSAKHRAEVTDAAVRQESAERQVAELQKLKDSHAQALADLQATTKQELEKSRVEQAAD